MHVAPRCRLGVCSLGAQRNCLIPYCFGVLIKAQHRIQDTDTYIGKEPNRRSRRGSVIDITDCYMQTSLLCFVHMSPRCVAKQDGGCVVSLWFSTRYKSDSKLSDGICSDSVIRSILSPPVVGSIQTLWSSETADVGRMFHLLELPPGSEERTPLH